MASKQWWGIDSSMPTLKTCVDVNIFTTLLIPYLASIVRLGDPGSVQMKHDGRHVVASGRHNPLFLYWLTFKSIYCSIWGNGNLWLFVRSRASWSSWSEYLLGQLIHNVHHRLFMIYYCSSTPPGSFTSIVSGIVSMNCSPHPTRMMRTGHPFVEL